MKTKKTKNKELDKKNIKDTSKEVLSTKELKYIYPEDITTGEEKKTFRRRVRAKLKAYNKKLKAAENDKEVKAIEKEYNNWLKSTYTKPELELQD